MVLKLLALKDWYYKPPSVSLTGNPQKRSYKGYVLVETSLYEPVSYLYFFNVNQINTQIKHRSTCYVLEPDKSKPICEASNDNNDQ